jgi:hypothetical protein
MLRDRYMHKTAKHMPVAFVLTNPRVRNDGHDDITRQVRMGPGGLCWANG